MISHHHKCIFVHIPKAGGQSVELAFLKDLGLTWETRSELLLRPSENPKHPSALAHLKAKEYVALGFIDQSRFDEYFKFAIVRNPWARLVSSYHYLGYASNCSFNKFVTRNLPQPSLRGGGLHISSQLEYLKDTNGKMLVDFVGRLESLTDDFVEVCRLGNLPNFILEHRNKTKYKSGGSTSLAVLKSLARGKLTNAMTLMNTKNDYREYYSHQTRAIVEKLYADDIREFGYTF